MKAAAPAPAPAAAPAPAVDVAAQGAQTPPAPPVPGPQYVPPPQPAGMAMAEGGETPRKNPFRDFFSDINVMDVAVSALIVAGVIYSIQYHKFMMMLEKSGYTDLSSRLAKVESEIAAAKRKSTEANAAGRPGMRRRRGVITL